MERLAKTEVRFSMQNLLDASTFWALFLPIEGYASIAQKSGYSGIEYFPWRILPDIQAKTGFLSTFARGSIKSVHQSWRSERNIREILAHPSPKRAAVAFVTAPERVTSLNNLQKLQEILGKQIPLIIHPHHEWLGEPQSPIFDILKNKLVQPAPELLGRWKITSAKQFALEALKRGFDGLCLDLFHIRRNPTQGFTQNFGPWQESIPTLLPYTKEIHLGVGRSDFQGNFDSQKELENLYSGTQKTDIIPMLELIKKIGWKGPIVTEIPASGIGLLIRSKSPIITPTTLVTAHSKIVANLSEIMK